LLLGQIKKYVCLRSPDRPYFSAADPNLFNRKPEIVVPKSNSGISFSKFLVSRHLLKLFYDELHSFSTFFALNFDKKLAERCDIALRSWRGVLNITLCDKVCQ
jgi:hypothetical protein